MIPQEDCTTIEKQIDVESRFAGWISCFLGNLDHTVVKVELKGPDNTLRVRQVRVLGGPREQQQQQQQEVTSGDANSIQQQNCEAETLRVFRLITGQVGFL